MCKRKTGDVSLQQLKGVSTEYQLTPIQCMLNVEPASPVLGSIHSAVVSTSCLRYQHDSWNQSWVNVGPPSVTLAHIQRGAKHDTVINTGLMLGQRRRRWANISSALSQRLVFDRLKLMGHTDRENAQTQTERTNVNQHVPTFSEGRHNYVTNTNA